ncbi:hypothetical protein FXO38_32779 [Capsicum annuum]|uniref:DUF4220 domain-containing protein n=1 Tax=Capsicum annuum TaxID=4072 RepID=A0A2G2YMS6_CAPAN|nr:hypothetical protein FXO38_32779 [Capsicum annuum]PHT71004.1 hypothetical protein T459_26108 [Capsicum annuum]
MNYEFEEIWEAWDIRVVILFILTLQIILIFFSPQRKSFLIVHLGGPDTISAFALEDNALWHRYFLGLTTQGSSVAYVFFQTVPRNKLWIPTVLIYVARVIKYGKHIWALYLASLDRFCESIMKDPDPDPNYAKLIDEYSSKIAAKLSSNIEMIHSTMALWKQKNSGEAHYLFEKFKGLIVDLIFDFCQRNEIQNFFLILEAIDAFRVIEVEHNFIYDVLFTKMIVANSYSGYLFRLICFLLEVVAAILFYRWDKRGLPR